MKNIYDIKKDKNLNYILPMTKKAEALSGDIKNEKIGVFIHLYYLDSIEKYMKYIKCIPEYIDLFITYSSEEMKDRLQGKVLNERANCKIVYKENRGRDISALLVAFREEILKYKYICFLHDKKEKRDSLKEDTEMWIRCLWENMVESKEYINNILGKFEENKQLGILAPPAPLSDHFMMACANLWGSNFNMTKQLSEKLKLNCDLNPDKTPITIGTVFWARVDALRKLLEVPWKYEDFDEEPLRDDGTISHAIERILAYVAQDAGYDTGWVMTDRYASESLEYSQASLTKAFRILKSYLGVRFISELDYFEQRRQELLDFYKKHNNLYIYGAGVYGKDCLAVLKSEGIKIRAFLVSDMNVQFDFINDIPIYSFDKANLSEDVGIIVAVSEKYQDEIIQVIKSRILDSEKVYIYKKG